MTQTKPRQVCFRGDRLASLRRERGETQQQVADALKIGRVTISNLERGWQEASIRVLLDVAMHFDVKTDYLLDLTDER